MSTLFATDADLLHWEPGLLTEASAVAQPLLSGSGSLSGTTFTIGSGSLTTAPIEPDHVLVLGSPVSGSFPIVSVTNPTTLQVSVLYDQLSTGSGGASPFLSGSGSAVPYSIRTFWPQRSTVSELLLSAAGIKAEDIATLLNPQALKRPCVLGTLQMIYTTLAAASQDPSPLLVRADLYERLYRRSFRSVTLELDTDGDGSVDSIRPLNVLRFQRS